MVKKIVAIEGLGKCEHCGTLFSMEDMPAGAIDADWACPQCKKNLSHKSFGYIERKGKWKKEHWIGPQGAWVEERPKNGFVLGSWDVHIPPLVSMFR